MNIVFYLIILLLYGCGPEGSLNNLQNNNTANNEDTNNTQTFPITVERGPVFMGLLTDSLGKKAINDNLGFSNVYVFNTQPSYPIKIEGGYIDINRNGKLDLNDTKLDINMSSYSSIISPLTTLIGNEPLVIEKLNQYYEINKSKVTQEVPSLSSKNAILLSNIAYIALKNNFKIGSNEFNQTVDKVEILYQENFSEITDLKELSLLLEKEVLNDETVEQISETSLTNIENNLSNNIDIVNVPSSENNVSVTESISMITFDKKHTTRDNIQDIWNIALSIPKNTNIDNFNIAAHILKDEPQTVGDIIIQGISIKNNKVVDIHSINVFGKKVSGSTGSIGYDASHSITKSSIVIIQNNILLIKFGSIMEEQSVVSKESFKRIATYTINLYLSKINVGSSSIKKNYDLQLDYNTFYTFSKETQTIQGRIQIGE